MSGDALHPLTVEVTRLREQLVRSDAALRQARAELAEVREEMADHVESWSRIAERIAEERDEALATLAEVRRVLDGPRPAPSVDPDPVAAMMREAGA